MAPDLKSNPQATGALRTVRKKYKSEAQHTCINMASMSISSAISVYRLVCGQILKHTWGIMNLQNAQQPKVEILITVVVLIRGEGHMQSHPC